MSKSVMELSEKQVQEFIADFPWLLNLDYETIPELKNKGMEYGLYANKRADLLLRDRKTGRLVIVEFKKVEFNRENVGQILEYRTRIINEYINKDTDLKDIFGTMLLTPILILVVPNCTAEARLTCNLSGVEIYEYDKTVPEIIVPEKRKALESLISEMKKDIIPFDEDRCEKVDGIYKEIRELLEEEDLLEAGWTTYKRPKGEYFDNIAHVFVNKWLFNDSDIGIGVYEDIFNDFNKIVIEFCSKSEEALNDFKEKCSEANLKFTGDEQLDEDDESKWDVNTWTFHLDKKAFVENVKEMLRPFIRIYKRIIY
ncbi:MAG: hypothetical protein PHY90_07055 [Desulfitobacteriaceae bacterium]|nr:hypothetical protein [Desulfitobacteriaceae bacterium]